jgi:predicted Fe-Mo cluster-binding NifX family protein
MKICITAKEDNLDSELDPRFGRAQNYLIYDSETKEVQVVPNSNIEATGGAGVAASQLMADLGVEAVISGNFGPNAANGLKALNINMYTSPEEAINKVLEKYAAGELTQVANATVEGKH